MTFKEAIAQLHLEDAQGLCKDYLRILEDIKSTKGGWGTTTYLRELPDQVITKLTDTQIALLSSMPYKGGYCASLRQYGITSAPKPLIVKRSEAIATHIQTHDHSVLTKQDLKFVSTYIQNKWRKVNPSTRYNKGTQMNFSMDEFSLTIFKNSITKPFARTEGKNLILKVNTGYEKSTKDNTATSIRNRFYKLILENTLTHTKALINAIHPTYVNLNNGTFYYPHPEESLSLSLYQLNDHSALSSSYSSATWSTDVAVVTDYKGLDPDDIRAQMRAIAAASGLLTLAEKTECSAYTTIAERMLSLLPQKTKDIALQMTNSVDSLRTLIKKDMTNE